MLATKREEIIARRAKVKQKEHGGTAPGKKKNTSGKIGFPSISVSSYLTPMSLSLYRAASILTASLNSIKRRLFLIRCPLSILLLIQLLIIFKHLTVKIAMSPTMMLLPLILSRMPNLVLGVAPLYLFWNADIVRLACARFLAIFPMILGLTYKTTAIVKVKLLFLNKILSPILSPTIALPATAIFPTIQFRNIRCNFA